MVRDILAFSRSGLVCPFTTRIVDRLVDLGPLFEAYPEAIVCGEMIGPENPYTAHDYADVDSLAFRTFDWRDRIVRELDAEGREGVVMKTPDDRVVTFCKRTQSTNDTIQNYSRDTSSGSNRPRCGMPNGERRTANGERRTPNTDRETRTNR